jgi:hypothetical protein
MELTLKVNGISQTTKLTAKGLEIAKCSLPTEGFGLHRNAMGTINVLQSIGASKQGDVQKVKGTIEQTTFTTEDGEVKSSQWFIPE